MQIVRCYSIHQGIADQSGPPMSLGKAGVKPLAGLQELFLRSSCPAAALQMRKDLQQWAEALALAQQLDPTAAGPLARQYAQVRCVRDPLTSLESLLRVLLCIHFLSGALTSLWGMSAHV